MRVRGVAVVGLLLTGCSAMQAKPQIVASTPASVEIECMGLVPCSSPQVVADAAQAHCQQYGLNAQARTVARAPSGNERAIFDCVAAPNLAQQQTAPR